MPSAETAAQTWALLAAFPPEATLPEREAAWRALLEIAHSNTISERWQVNEQVRRMHIASSPIALDAFILLRFSTISESQGPCRTNVAALHSATKITSLHLLRLDPYNVVDRGGLPVSIARLSLLTRRPDMSSAAFRHYWHTLHAPLGAAHRGISRYVQFAVDEQHCLIGDDVEPIDGLGLFGIVDLAAMLAGYEGTPAGQRMREDSQRFLATSTTFMLKSFNPALREPAR
jgi:hypothetical protein